MATVSNNMSDWMRDMEKRVMHQERRPSVRPTNETVGYGISAYSIRVDDWNSDGPIINGYFYSDGAQVINSPDDSRNWMGVVYANPIGQGIQRVWEYLDDVSDPLTDPEEFTRAFITNSDGTRTYTPWMPGGSGGGGGGGGPPTGPAGGDLTGTYPNPVISTATRTAMVPDVADEGIIQVADVSQINFVGSGVTATPGATGIVNVTIPGGGGGGAPTGPAGGDLAGTYPNPTIGTGKVTSAAIADGTIQAADLAAGVIPTPPTTLPPSGAAGGDLSGTYPNPTVIQGRPGFTAQAMVATSLTGGAAISVRTPSFGDTNERFYVNGTGTIFLGSGTATPDVNLYRDVADSLRTSDKFTADAGLVSGAQADMTNHKIVNVTDPTNAQDAATKAYVDNVVQGLDTKQSVKGTTIANIADLTNPSLGTTADAGITWNQGDRILVKNQTTAAQNGIYIVGASGLTRATDMDAWSEVPGAFTFIEQGTQFADTGWVSTADQGGTMGTTAITWTQFSGAGGGTIRKFAGAVGALVAGIETQVVHNLGTMDVVSRFRNSFNLEIELSVRTIDVNTLGVVADVAYAASAIRAVVVG